MSDRNLQNKDGEILSAEDEKISLMLGSLKRVDAPNDFNFRVKARIANGQPADSGLRILPALRYVLPLSLAAFVAAFLFLNNFYFVSNQSTQPIAENESPAPIQQPLLPETTASTSTDEAKNENQVQPENNTSPETPLPVKSEPKAVFENKNVFVAVKSETKPKTENLPKDISVPDENKGGGSRDSALTPIEKVITPEGIPDVNKTVESKPVIENKTSLTTAEILSQLGIETVSENGKLKVKTVKGASLGDSSGVKAGDLIEAIDGKNVFEAPMNSQTIEVKRLTITRGTEKIEISLHK